MFFVSVTRLRLKRFWNLPAFLWFSVRSVLQARGSEGNMDVETLMERARVFWTVTVWRTKADMLAFRDSGAHTRVMTRLARWCDEAAHVHWEQERAEPPSWIEAWERLVKDGISVRVEEPSPDHAVRNFRCPRVN